VWRIWGATTRPAFGKSPHASEWRYAPFCLFDICHIDFFPILLGLKLRVSHRRRLDYMSLPVRHLIDLVDQIPRIPSFAVLAFTATALNVSVTDADCSSISCLHLRDWPPGATIPPAWRAGAC
jgi:hypothetical protein